MSDPEDHYGWAEQAFGEAEQMQRTMKLRWAAVAYFYSALHMIHTALPTLAGVPTSHQHPDAHAGQDGTLTVVRKHIRELDAPYRSLFSTSVDVRYRGAEVPLMLIERHRNEDLPPIGEWVCGAAHEDYCACWLRSL